MKTKMSNYRNCFALAYVLLVAVIFCGCEEPVKQTIKEEKFFYAKLDRYNNKFKIVVIDSCEYLYTDAGNNGQTVFHKGNCKFCVERSKK